MDTVYVGVIAAFAVLSALLIVGCQKLGSR